MAHEIDHLPVEITLGKQGERGANSILFDISAWKALYPTGAGEISSDIASDGLRISYTRHGETAVYPELPGSLSIETTTDDDGAETTILAWVPSAAVMDVAGHGTVVIHCTENGIEKRSAMTSTYVEAGHGSEGTAPEPMADWMADAQALLDELEAKWVDAPATASSTGTAGQMASDGIHLYICVATDTWMRGYLESWGEGGGP